MELINLNAIIGTVLSVAFLAWAYVIKWIANGLFERLDNLQKSIDNTNGELSSYIVQTETRLAVLEDRVVKNRS